MTLQVSRNLATGDQLSCVKTSVIYSVLVNPLSRQIKGKMGLDRSQRQDRYSQMDPSGIHTCRVPIFGLPYDEVPRGPIRDGEGFSPHLAIPCKCRGGGGPT